MDNAELIAVATQEIEHPTFGMVEQFLEIHELVYHAGRPEIAGITVDDVAKRAIVYFSVKGQAFHFAVQLNTESEIQVYGADTEDFCRVSFAAYSENMSLQQLAGLTNLTPSDSYDKGDKLGIGEMTANGSSLEFQPNPEPGAAEGKLKKLLTFLEQDVAGVKKLIDEAGGTIEVHAVFHNGNTMLGGIHLDKEDIQRLAALNLDIDFDLYAAGNSFK